MKKTTHVEQVIWGVSLGMATDDEIISCYTYIKEHLQTHSSKFEICSQSKGTKVIRPDRGGISFGMVIATSETVWLCGKICNTEDMCNKIKSIDRNDFEALVISMVSNEIEIDMDKVIENLKRKNFIKIYPCGRIFVIGD